MHELDELTAAWSGLDRSRAVLATLVQVEGSSYRRVGARMLLGLDGLQAGIISAGCLERDLAARVEPVLASGQPEVVVYDGSTDDELIWGMGMGCRGVLHVLLEPAEGPGVAFTFEVLSRVLQSGVPQRLVTVYEGPRRGERWSEGPAVAGSLDEMVEPPPALTVFGTGSDAVCLAQAADLCGLHVTVCGVGSSPRGWTGRFVEMTTAAEGELPLVADGALVIMSHHFYNDQAALRRALGSELAYIGCLGPRHRYEAMREGASLGDDPRVFSPVGLDIAARTPREIATAIVAEVVAVLRGRAGGSLRARALRSLVAG